MPPGLSAPHAPVVNRHARADSTRASRSHAWWLPYLLVECDKNEVLIDALGTGSTLESPRWEYKTTLSVDTRDCGFVLITLVIFPGSVNCLSDSI